MRTMRKHSTLVLAIGLSLVLRVATVFAQDSDKAADDEATDMELLEFIGEWETADGSWVDPMALQQELETSQQQNSAVNEDSKDETK